MRKGARVPLLASAGSRAGCGSYLVDGIDGNDKSAVPRTPLEGWDEKMKSVQISSHGEVVARAEPLELDRSADDQQKLIRSENLWSGHIADLGVIAGGSSPCQRLSRLSSEDSALMMTGQSCSMTFQELCTARPAKFLGLVENVIMDEPDRDEAPCSWAGIHTCFSSDISWVRRPRPCTAHWPEWP